MDLSCELMRLSRAIGVSGREDETSTLCLELVRPFMDEARLDEFGNVVASRRGGVTGAPLVILDAHIDQVGFAVCEITPEGFLRPTPVGASYWDLIGKKLSIETETGRISGVALVEPGCSKPNEDSSLRCRELLIDIGCTREEAERLVRVGDSIVWDEPCAMLSNELYCGAATDDRACFLALVRVAELLYDKPLPVDLRIIGSVKEETDGLGARIRAYRDRPDFALCVDVGGDENFGQGPVIPAGPVALPKVADKLLTLAGRLGISAIPRCNPALSGTNAKHYQLTRSGVNTGYISMPQKYMHTPAELVCLSDIEATARLIAEWLLSIESKAELSI